VRARRAIAANFPYVDDDTRNILQRAMDQAKDLRDFGEILCDIVCSEDVNELTIFLAYGFAENNRRITGRLQEAGKHTALGSFGLFRDYMNWDDAKAALIRDIECLKKGTSTV
jgi:hypothetical protein